MKKLPGKKKPPTLTLKRTAAAKASQDAGAAVQKKSAVQKKPATLTQKTTASSTAGTNAPGTQKAATRKLPGLTKTTDVTLKRG